MQTFLQIIPSGIGLSGDKLITEKTIETMSYLASKGAINPRIIQFVGKAISGTSQGKDTQAVLKRANLILNAVKRTVTYKPDPKGIELLSEPDKFLYELKTGDCDDYATALAACYLTLGLSVRFVIVGLNGQNDYSHVFLQVEINGNWYSVEGIVADSYVGWDPSSRFKFSKRKNCYVDAPKILAQKMGELGTNKCVLLSGFVCNGCNECKNCGELEYGELGFSLKRPKWVRKITPTRQTIKDIKKVVVKITPGGSKTLTTLKNKLKPSVTTLRDLSTYYKYASYVAAIAVQVVPGVGQAAGAAMVAGSQALSKVLGKVADKMQPAMEEIQQLQEYANSQVVQDITYGIETISDKIGGNTGDLIKSVLYGNSMISPQQIQEVGQQDPNLSKILGAAQEISLVNAVAQPLKEQQTETEDDKPQSNTVKIIAITGSTVAAIGLLIGIKYLITKKRK